MKPARRIITGEYSREIAAERSARYGGITRVPEEETE
jgi:hypothetical protein